MSTDRTMQRYRELRKTLKESFSFKLFRAFAVSTVTVLLVFTLFFIHYQNRKVTDNLVNEGRMFAGLLAYSSRVGVFAENRELLKDAVQGIMSQKDVLSVSIYTADDKILVHDQKKGDKKNRKAQEEKKGFVPKSGGPRPVGVNENARTIEVTAPVVIESLSTLEEFYYDSTSSHKKEEIIGYVTVAMDKTVLWQNIVAVLVRSFAIAAVFLLTGTVIIYLSIKRVTRPLTRLTEAVRLLGLGVPVEKMPVETPDEVGKLATAFNTMSDNLKERDEEAKHLEEKLRYAEKMEAVGTLARGIAHDFNNILTTTKGSVYLLEKKLHGNDALKHYAEQIHNSLDKAKNLIESLLTFSRIQAINPVPVDLNGLIRRLKPMLVNLGGEKVEVRISLSEGDLTVRVDVLQIEQVLMNLCANARDAMPDGGLLTIETGSVPGRSAHPDELPSPEEEKYALITVTDNGLGMDDGLKDRIFEPFFTTKEVGKGMGLGLSIVYGIIEQHRGRIEVNTRKGKGTVFLIYIPLCDKDCGG